MAKQIEIQVLALAEIGEDVRLDELTERLMAGFDEAVSAKVLRSAGVTVTIKEIASSVSAPAETTAVKPKEAFKNRPEEVDFDFEKNEK
jgi:hypothetical protein